jgi:hypothetical protein
MNRFPSLLLVALALWSGTAGAVPNTVSKGGRSSENSDKYRYEMNLDLSAMFVRDTRPIGGSDTGAKLSVGGMFASWIGLDALGMYHIKSKSFLVGGDIRLVPIDWLYFKAGGGAFNDRLTRSLKATPILGMGLMARFTEYYYMNVESMYFTGPDGGKNIGVGAGFGLIF